MILPQWKILVMKMKSINKQHNLLQLLYLMKVLLTLTDCFETQFRMHQSICSPTTIVKVPQLTNTRKDQVKHMMTGCFKQSNLTYNSLS